MDKINLARRSYDFPAFLPLMLMTLADIGGRDASGKRNEQPRILPVPFRDSVACLKNPLREN